MPQLFQKPNRVLSAGFAVTFLFWQATAPAAAEPAADATEAAAQNVFAPDATAPVATTTLDDAAAAEIGTDGDSRETTAESIEATPEDSAAAAAAPEPVRTEPSLEPLAASDSAAAADADAATLAEPGAGTGSEAGAATAETTGKLPEAAPLETVDTPATDDGTATANASSSLKTAIMAAFDNAEVTKGANGADVAAARAHYDSEQSAVWFAGGQPSEAAKAIIKELRAADEWGLDPAAYTIVEPAFGADETALAEAEVRLMLMALTYARHAQGGRLVPTEISPIWDVSPEIEEPSKAVAALISSPSPDAVLRGYHPQHAEFEALRRMLVELRNPNGAREEVDESLLVRMPPGKVLRRGSDDPDVALLRKRLKTPMADGGSDTVFDEPLEIALMAFQEGEGVRADGILGPRTRAALNGELVEEARNPQRDIERIVVNMERWRWLPKDLGPQHIINNVPEFMGRVIKDGETIFEERIIVGLPTWPTPMMTDQMDFIVFNPEWGMPNGIKVKELLPRLRRASAQSSGGGFFEQLFGGGGGASGGGARVLEAYNLKPSLNGRPIDANKIDWNSVDIRRFTFIQPAGTSNPLGTVKFMFPNKHDVYMHDTTQRSLFNQSRRALSHGCIRVQNPGRLAEILLAEDKGWSAEQVKAQYRGGTNTVHLATPVPVYLAYFTARPSDDGKLQTFSDIYGHDNRLMAALTGKPMRYSPPAPASDPIATIETSSTAPASSNKKKQAAPAAKRQPGDSAGDLISNALSGILNN